MVNKINPRAIELAKRQGNKEAPVERTIIQPKTQSPIAIQNIIFPDSPSESFLMSYDGPHGTYFQELISKVNERFSGTRAEIPAGTSGEIQGHLIKRMGLMSTIANDSSLRSSGLHPITATQSEYLLEEGKLTNPRSNWEDFGMVLFDRSSTGYNPQEAQALYDSLRAHRQDL